MKCCSPENGIVSHYSNSTRQNQASFPQLSSFRTNVIELVNILIDTHIGIPTKGTDFGRCFCCLLVSLFVACSVVHMPAVTYAYSYNEIHILIERQYVCRHACVHVCVCARARPCVCVCG